MFKDLIGLGEKKRPFIRSKEKKDKFVPSQRFNEMIDYYTTELRSRLSELDSLKAENEMLIKTSLKNASRSDELRLHVQKLQEEVRLLQQKLQERRG
jgi:HPt (histidine-containing phosphotransfer) domain-containing protein